MSERKYTVWFDQTYRETYLIVRRAGYILLAHLCPALLGDLDELLSCTYNEMSRKEWRLRRHPNVIGWLIVAFRYVVYHRIRAWYREQRILERCKNARCTAGTADPFQEAMNLLETEEMMRAAIGDRRYALLRAHRFEGIPVRELAARTGKSIHAMEVSLWRWRKVCEKVLKSHGKLFMMFLWINVNFRFFLGV